MMPARVRGERDTGAGASAEKAAIRNIYEQFRRVVPVETEHAAVMVALAPAEKALALRIQNRRVPVEIEPAFDGFGLRRCGQSRERRRIAAIGRDVWIGI